MLVKIDFSGLSQPKQTWLGEVRTHLHLGEVMNLKEVAKQVIMGVLSRSLGILLFFVILGVVGFCYLAIGVFKVNFENLISSILKLS